MDQHEQNQNSQKTIIIIAALILSVIANLGIGVLYYSDQKIISEQGKEIINLKNARYSSSNLVKAKINELKNIQADLERITKERARLGLSNDSLSKQLASLRGTINGLKNKSSIDKSEIAKLNNLIAELKDQILQRDKQVAELIQRNDSLNTNLTSLKSENEKLNKFLASTTSVLEKAAVLKIENIKVAGLKENGKELNDLKGKRIDRLRISFNISENSVANKGEKSFYISLTTPQGKVFTDFRNGGGIVQLKSGGEANYTLNKVAQFNNKNEKVIFDMPKGFDYKPGNYEITIYADGYEIGKTSIKIK